MQSVQNNLSEFQQGHEEIDNKRYSDLTNDSEVAGFLNGVREEFQFDDRESCSHLSLINLFISRNTSCEQFIPNQNKKAVNWLITFCWTQNYSLETLWNSIGYYYAYVNIKSVQKGKLTVLLLTLVNLSLKLFEVEKVLNFGKMQKLLGKNVNEEVFIEIENQVLELFEFDMFFENNLGKVFHFAESQKEKQRILFLCEMLFLTNFEVGISKASLKQLCQLANDPKINNDAKKELIKLSGAQKHFKIIKQKYSSQFDVDEYWQEIIE